MLLKLNHTSEVAQSLLPLFLENVDLAAGYVGFDVSWIPHERLRQSTKGTLIVVDTSICNRENDEHGFAIVRALIRQITQITDGLSWLTTIKVGYCTIEQSVIV